MRLLVVITHYFKREESVTGIRLHGSQFEPLSRIASFNEVVVGYHRLFGPIYRVEARRAPPTKAGNAAADVIDVVVVAMKGADLLPVIGIDPLYYTVHYVEGDPKRLQFHAQPILRDRMGGYDFYCVIEDDLITRDPDFFAKLAWFQNLFGPARMSATRCRRAGISHA